MHALDADTVALWHLDDPLSTHVVEDEVGNYHLTPTAAPLVGRGREQNCVLPLAPFTPVRFPGSAVTFSALNGFSIEFWLQITPGPVASTGYVLGGGYPWFYVSLSRTFIMVTMNETETAEVYSTPFQIPDDGAPHHIAVTFTAPFMKGAPPVPPYYRGVIFYLDGNNLASAEPTLEDLQFGYWGGVDTNAFNGWLSDMRFSAKKRSAAEIAISAAPIVPVVYKPLLPIIPSVQSTWLSASRIINRLPYEKAVLSPLTPVTNGLPSSIGGAFNAGFN